MVVYVTLSPSTSFEGSMGDLGKGVAPQRFAKLALLPPHNRKRQPSAGCHKSSCCCSDLELAVVHLQAQQHAHLVGAC